MTTRPTIVRDLSQPGAYPHPCEAIRVMETHISWVFLTGRLAYKVKKPVDLGFADFSTLEKRQHYCEEELRLNRRLAPELYQRVVPVTRDDGSLRIDGTGAVVDYAVCMRQFNVDRVMDKLPVSALTPARVDALADELADFHDAAAVAPASAEYGTPKQIEKQLGDVLQRIPELCPELSGRLAELKKAALAMGRSLEPIFEERRSEGFIRECHGDLHLGNLFLDGDRITVFDGIEFSNQLRWIDVFSDLSFLTMDLDDHSVSSVGRRLLNRWLERTGDFRGLKVYRFYGAYRALVRAMVTLMQPDDSASAANTGGCPASVTRYLDLADHYLTPKSPELWITFGVSGSGKTFITQGLLESRDGMVRLRSDVERKRLFRLRPEESSQNVGNQTVYSVETSQRVYDRLLELAEQLLTSGMSVVVDATFLRRANRGAFLELSRRMNCPFRLLVCSADPATLRQRILNRRVENRDASEADVEVLEHQLRNREPLTLSEQGFVADWQKTEA